VAEISVSIVCDQTAARKGLEALVSGTPGMTVLSTHADGDEVAAGLETRPCDVLVLRLSSARGLARLVGALATRFPTLRLLTLAPDPGEEAMLELVQAGASGCLPAASTAPARLVDAIAELHRGGAPLTPRLASALVRLVRAKKSGEPLPAPPISRRETELLRLLAEGHSYKTAAAELGLSIDTVRFHLRNLYAKLQVHSKVEAVLKGLRDGLI
jgi:DNA-binding NarL/FixJ family response regulator